MSKKESRITVKRVWHGERLLGLEHCRIRDARLVLRVVVQLVPAEVPAPRLVVAPDEALVADRVERGRLRRDADHRVRAPLAGRPVQLPDVQAAREADPSANAVRALRDRVPVERQRVLFFHEYVQRPIVGVPRVFQLDFPAMKGLTSTG